MQHNPSILWYCYQWGPANLKDTHIKTGIMHLIKNIIRKLLYVLDTDLYVFLADQSLRIIVIEIGFNCLTCRCYDELQGFP